MAEKDFVELKQEDVFSYIDKELKSEQTAGDTVFKQKTKNNFFHVFVVDLIALIIALCGFIYVYNNFKAGEYKLVGTEGSIKGLEDVLSKEIQKKATADLLKKQQELADAQNKINELNSRMDDFKKQQQIKLNSQLNQLQDELKKKMDDQLKSASDIEKQTIRRKYEEDLKNGMVELQKQSDSNSQALMAQLQELKNKEASFSTEKEAELVKSRVEMQSNNQSLQAQLENQKKNGQQKIDELNQQLAQNQKSEDFNNQIETLFNSAIGNYKNNNFTGAAKILSAIPELYQNKPQDLAVSHERQVLDIFFVSNMESTISLITNPASEFNPSIENSKAEPVYTEAVNDYNKNYPEAAWNAFEQVLLNYPESKYAKDSIDYINRIKTLNVRTITNVQTAPASRAITNISINYESMDKFKSDQDKEAQALFNIAELDRREMRLDAAAREYRNLIEHYPFSSYISGSLKGLESTIKAQSGGKN